MKKEEILTGKCSGCTHKSDDGSVSFVCLSCKRQYYPNMEREPYERKTDKYTGLVFKINSEGAYVG